MIMMMTHVHASRMNRMAALVTTFGDMSCHRPSTDIHGLIAATTATYLMH